MSLTADSAENGKRQRSLSRKALQNAIEEKGQEVQGSAQALKRLCDTAMANHENVSNERVQAIQTASETYKRTLDELGQLFQQDKWGDYDQEAAIAKEFSVLERARALTRENEHLNDRASQSSSGTKYTSASRVSSSSSSARRRAQAEAAVARKQAEYDRMIAEKETARRLQEADERRRQEEQRAQHDHEIALMRAERVEAIANAKLQAIDEAIAAEVEASECELPGVQGPAETAERVGTWVQNQATSAADGPNQLEKQQPPAATYRQYSLENQRPKFPTLPKEAESTPKQSTCRNLTAVNTDTPVAKTQRGRTGRPLVTSTPREEYSLLETFAVTNQRLVAGISRQNLPKCHPDTFSGDVTLFHPWKRSFKAMVADAEVSASQETNYLRNFTAGSAQEVVDNFRRRQHEDPAKVLKCLWEELERRFGNTAAITNNLLERLTETAKFHDKDPTGLQTFADLCADIDSQLQYLPGLGSLNYPNVLRPIIESLPSFLRSKWEKEIVKYALKHQDMYPGFHEFASMIEGQARMKSHPNVVASGVQDTNISKTRIDILKKNVNIGSRSDTNIRSVLKTDASNEQEKYCLFHQRKGHSLKECKAFDEKTFQERSEWIQKAKLCFRCFEANHIAKDCKADVRCEICESDRHPTLLHRERDHGEEVTSKCTSMCNGRRGGLSCSKIILVDVSHQNRPDETRRIYALIDDQSNASMITSDLANELQVNGPAERYLLSTCSATKTVTYGRRVPGLVISANGKSARLPTLIECNSIPQEKHEIPTPEIAMQYDHLRGIANEIPPVDPQAKVQILIGRDAPELLKVRAFKNGPKGAPWAQKLDLGWTISGQVCLNRTGGPIHITARCTSISAAIQKHSSDPHEPEVSPCCNHFELKDNNPADLATGGTDANKLTNAQWLKGPQFLRQTDTSLESVGDDITLDEEDPEVRREITVNHTTITTGMGTERLARFSNWSSLRRAVAVPITMRKRWRRDTRSHRK
ncbi:hypothetical protein QZH41_003620 [Actinostola sp. cb2023]|nr:hypothetical protein QZH41_003620 [Actinostola sp. cb2023]